MKKDSCECSYIFWTCRDSQEAKKIIRKLLEEKLIACASLIPSVESIYKWEGKVEESVEVKVFLKTVKSHFAEILALISKDCSYDVPEIVEIPIGKGNPSYLDWIRRETAT